METIKFKTTIKCSGCVAKVTPYLNEELGDLSWNVETDNPAKVLTVVGRADYRGIISAVEKAGYKAEKIP